MTTYHSRVEAMVLRNLEAGPSPMSDLEKLKRLRGLQEMIQELRELEQSRARLLDEINILRNKLSIQS